MKSRLQRRSGIETSLLAAVLLFAAQSGYAQTASQPALESATQRDARMAWFREARFGLFIHWGLYAVPAGKWGDRSDYGEWIRDSAKIPVEEYNKFVEQFNPTRFNADEWVALAKDAGVRYIVITSKHHDGFALFDSKVSEFDVMATPFKRDMLRELSAACSKAGIRMCWYHSIMDWHHPDYLPRRPWEKERRPAADARLDRYVQYLKDQLRELLTNYGPIGILWFDGQWEPTWTNELGSQIEQFVRGIQPQIIINSRVGRGGGPYGIDRAQGGMGDYATPEQFIPETGIPGVDWETCMTMNDHWGYCAADHNWKSSREMIRMLVDIASKGGNLLLNVGPTSEGLIPPESVERLRAIGAWLRIHGDAIYGTRASPMAAPQWGRVTMRKLPGDVTRLYLHVFDWPKDGTLTVPGLLNPIVGCSILSSKSDTEKAESTADGVAIRSLPQTGPNADCSVIVLDVRGAPDIAVPPTIAADSDIFVDSLPVKISSAQPNVTVHYTLDGSDPTRRSPLAEGPIVLKDTTVVKARAFRGDRAMPAAQAAFRKVAPRKADAAEGTQVGLGYEYFEGSWDQLPDFATMTPKKAGITQGISSRLANRPEFWALQFTGFIEVTSQGVYRFFTVSDDGSRLWIGDELVVDNDGLHGSVEKSGRIALATGRHAIRIAMFQKTGDVDLRVLWQQPDLPKGEIPTSALSHKP
ncbi:MAG: alpha-L-fucosidase [Phycisphaerae bacterium]